MRIPYGKGIELYGKSPPVIQRTVGIFLSPLSRSVMLGSGFHAFLQELRRTQWYTPQKLKEYQERRLRALIKHAYQNVPYYHKLFKENGITSDDVKTIQDLKKIPILTKNDLRKNFKDLIALNASTYKFGLNSTSGSTGKPVLFYLDQQNREIEYASTWRQREWAGVNLNDKIACFRAFRAMKGTDYKSGKPLWKYNALSKEIEFNIFPIDQNSLKKQVDKLKKYSPRLIQGYPSTISLISKYILDNNIKGISPVAIQTSSESLGTRREIIEKAFGCKIYDWYGQSEYAASAGQCPAGNYHVTESGIMEIIRDGETVASGELGEIIGTRLYNFSMPLIRYQITDICRCSNDICTCGRGIPIIKSIEGRLADSMLTSDRRLVTGMALEHYLKHDMLHFTSNFEYIHLIQETESNILIQIVAKKTLSLEEEKAIRNSLNRLLGHMEITFEYLTTIPKNPKWRFSESRLNIKLF